MSDRADYYPPDPRGDRKCKPGNKHEPKRCAYHAEHFWCGTCEGFYGVPHDFMHEGPGAHPLRTADFCVCRLCQQRVVLRQTR